MPRLLALMATAVMTLTAETWPIEKLFARPYVWGTSPDEVVWSKQGHTLAFLWNESGNRFLDLYAYHPGSRKRVRLTRLEDLKDDLLKSGEEKDSRRKDHLAPQAGLSSFSLSQDGRRAAFSFKGDLFVVPTDGAGEPMRLTRTKAAESDPQFSPVGARLASLRGGQIVIQDLSSGQLWQVTDVEAPATLLSYDWSPDGKRFFYTVRKSARRQMPLPNYSGRFVRADSFSRSVAGDEPADIAWHIVDAQGGEPVAVDLGKWGGRIHAAAAEWSPDSKWILTAATHSAMKRIELRAIEAATGKSRVLVEENDDAWAFDPDYGWSPDARHVWFNSERDGFAHLYRVSIDGGQPVQLTRGTFEVRKDRFTHAPHWVGDSLYFTSTEAGPSERHFYRLRPLDAQPRAEKLSSAEGINDGLVSQDGAHTAWLKADLKNPFDLWVDDQRVTESPRPEFHRASWPETRLVTFPSRGDGKTVHAKLLLPPGYRIEDRSQPSRPCVFFIHGAGYATSVLKEWGSYNILRFAFNAWLANQGYVVMDLDYRGSSGYGRDWRAGVYLHMGGRDLDDVLGAVDYVKSLGNIDMKRLGIWGASYGGFMTAMAMFLSPETFRAGSSWASVNDWENYNAGYTSQRLNTPHSNPEVFRRSSPILFSHKLKNPLQIIHGMGDSNVLFQDAVQLTEKLVQEGANFEHFFYPQENHGFVRDETWVDAFGRTAAWFARHLR